MDRKKVRATHRRHWARLCLGFSATAWLGRTSRAIGTSASTGNTYHTQIHVENRNRSYFYYLPPQYQPGTSLPLLLGFHPFLQPNRSWERYVGLKAAADRFGFILAMPQGEGWGMFRSFNAGLRDDSNDPDDVVFTASMINDLSSRIAYDRSRVYAIGMSNGGMLTHALAQQLPGVLAGIVSVSGTPARPLAAGTLPTPVMMVHGTTDPITPWTGPSPRTPKFIHFQDVNSTLAQWRSINGSAIEPVSTIYDRPGDRTHILRHDWPAPPALAETVMIQIEEGGHRWPALNKQIYFPRTGNQSRDVDMTTLAWEFLSRQKRQFTP